MRMFSAPSVAGNCALLPDFARRSLGGLRAGSPSDERAPKQPAVRITHMQGLVVRRSRGHSPKCLARKRPQAGAPLQRWGREAKKQHKRSTVQWWCPAIWRHAATTTPHPSSAASLSAANGEWSAGAGGLAMGIRRIQGTRNAGTWNSGIELSTIPSSLWPLPPSCRDCRKSCAHSTGPRDPSKAAAASPP